MFVIDRSFQYWKEYRLSALTKKVLRSVKKNKKFKVDDALIIEVENRYAALEAAKRIPFAKQADINRAVKKATTALSNSMLKLADAVENQTLYKSDVVLSGFHPGRVQRSPRYVKKAKA